MLALLHELQGIDFVRQLKLITERHEFTPLPNEQFVYIVGGETSPDFANLLIAARKAVEHGYRVFILPNPKGIRTADFIFERKGVYRMYDLKSITGAKSVGNRLLESVGQTNRVLLNISANYNPVSLARCIRTYFEKNPQAIEVLVFKGKKTISVLRDDTVKGASFFKYFIAKYIQ